MGKYMPVSWNVWVLGTGPLSPSTLEEVFQEVPIRRGPRRQLQRFWKAELREGRKTFRELDRFEY